MTEHKKPRRLDANEQVERMRARRHLKQLLRKQKAVNKQLQQRGADLGATSTLLDKIKKMRALHEETLR